MSEIMDIAHSHPLLETENLLQCADKKLVLSTPPRIMGILNLTPDSFYDGGRHNTIDQALKRVEEMVAQGADIIDVGAESSRPYAQIVPLEVEIERLMSVLAAIQTRFDVLLSVDSYKPEIMREAIALGVHLINDIFALQQAGALEVVADSQVGVCLMHMQGTPDSMQNNPVYENLVDEVIDFLKHRLEACRAAGISANRIVIDPGFGFGKSTPHNMNLLKNLSAIKCLGFPIMVGLSRKASIGEILSVAAEERLFGSLSAQVIAAMQGAAIIRTHDIKPTVEAMKIVAAVLEQESSQ